MNKLKAYNQLNKALTRLRKNGVMVEVIGLQSGSVVIHIPNSILTSFPGETSYSLWDTGIRIIPTNTKFDLTTGKTSLLKEQEDE